MTEQLIISGEPQLLARFDEALEAEFASRGVDDKVTVESALVPVEMAPGELGFGQEIRQVLIGVADVLRAGEKAIVEVAGGIARRLSQGSMTLRTNADGTIVVTARTGGGDDVAAMTGQIADILRAQKGS